MERTKDVELSGKRYQLTKMTPFVASRVHGWLKYTSVQYSQQQIKEHPEIIATAQATAAAPRENLVEFAEGVVGFMWTLASSFLSEETYMKVQNYAMRGVFVYPEPTNPIQTPLPVLMADGRFSVSELEQNAADVNTLILRSLEFSIAPFFLEGAQK
jgi:hypothetical protein